MLWNKKKRIYLDYASKTPTDPRVLASMKPFFDKNFSNPSSLHKEGQNSKKVLSDARKDIAKILLSNESEIIFTSGGTESNNLALLGVFDAALKSGIKNPHIISTEIEHPAILEVCKEIQKRGGEVTLVPVNNEGLVSSQDIFSAIKENTVLVTVMYANNEIGTIQPIKEIGTKIKQWREKNKTSFPYFHTDACQAGLYLSLNVHNLGLDLMTLDGIKMYGPSGVGILYVRGGVLINPILFGGGQEKGLRSGTENFISAMGFAKALEIAEEMKEKESARLIYIRDYAIEKILENFQESSLNGSKTERLPNNVNICFPKIDSEFAVVSLDVYGISASYTSSCKTLAEDSSSYVVYALGKEDCRLSSLRFTFGRDTKKEDIDVLIETLRKIMVLV